MNQSKSKKSTICDRRICSNLIIIPIYIDEKTTDVIRQTEKQLTKFNTVVYYDFRHEFKTGIVSRIFSHRER